MTSETPTDDPALSDSAPAGKFMRKKKLIDKSLQFKLIGVFTAVGLTCALFQIVLVNFGLLEVARAAPSGGEQILAEARSMMIRNVLWTVGALLPPMVCVGLILTHRVAGPAYRMTQHCRAIAEGGPVRPCKIREDDELQELCDALNAAIATIAPAGAGDRSAAGEEWSLDETPSLVRAVGSLPSEQRAEQGTEKPAA